MPGGRSTTSTARGGIGGRSDVWHQAPHVDIAGAAPDAELVATEYGSCLPHPVDRARGR